jgi:hypothetical protein
MTFWVVSNSPGNKRKNCQMNCIQPKSFCTAKETITRVKKQPTEWETVFVSYSSDRGLLSRTNKELKKWNSKRTNNPVNKRANEPNTFQMKNKPKKNYSSSRHQGSVNWSYVEGWAFGTEVEHLVPSKKRQTLTRVAWGDGEGLKRGWWEGKLLRPLWTSGWRFLK